MDKDQAVDFIIRQYSIGQPQAAITAELCRQLGAPAAVVEKFVQTTIDKSFPQGQAQVSAPASYPPPPKAAPGAWQDSDPNAIPSFAPDPLPEEDEDEIYVEPPAPAVTLNNITGPDYVVGDKRQVQSASMFLAGRTLDGEELPPSAPVDMPTQTSQEELQRLENDPELIALILKLAGRNTKQSDIVMTICERQGLDWKDAQRLTARVMSRNYKKIVTRQNVVLMPISIVIIVAGAALLLASILEFLRLRDLYLSQAEINVQMINQANYLIRGVLPWTLAGLGLLAGGVFGLIKAIRKQTEQTLKTIILQLDAYDDILSACDKMNWAKGERLLLVWPERGPILDRRLDMVRLQRRSRQMGTQLALATRDPDARYHALRLGIPVFTSVKKAQQSQWRAPHRFRREAARAAPPPRAEGHPLPDLDQLILAQQTAHPVPWRYASHPAWFALGVLAVLALAALLLPQAELRLTPAVRVQDVALKVSADDQLLAPDLSGRVSAHWQEVIVEGRQSRPAAGNMQLPDQPAQGQVIFTNLSDQTLVVPAGTVVRTQSDPPVRFVVSQAGKMAAGLGVTITLPILAEAPGIEGNLPAGALTAIEGLLGAQATAINPRPTTRGSNRSAPAPTAADRQTLNDSLRAALQDRARQELQAGLPEGDLLILPSLALAETLEANFLPAPGLPGDTLSLHQRLKFRALVVRGDDLRRLAETIFNANLPAGFSPQPDSLAWEVVYPAGSQPGLASSNRFDLHAHRQITAIVEEDRAVQAALGATPALAQQRLQGLLALETAPEIRLTPAWWPRLPIVPFRIHTIRLNP